MKTKFSTLLTALLMLFCMSANAQAVKGDVNGDGIVDNADIQEVNDIIFGKSQNTNGDVNGDGKVNVADIVTIVDLIENPPAANPAITFGVNIINKTNVSVTLDGALAFILGNPDHNGNYLGWEGVFNHTDPIRFSDTAVTLAAGEKKTFGGLTWKDEDTESGMGEKSPLSPSLLTNAKRPRNVLLYVGGSYEVVMCDNMDSNIVFEDGKTYDIVISSAPAANPVISFGVNIINKTNVSVTLDGALAFILGNPDHNGNYLGWEGVFNHTDPIRFSDTAVTLAAGEKKTFGGLTWKDEDTESGMGEKSPLSPSLLTNAKRPRNVLLYVGGSYEVVMCDNMDSNIVFEDGKTYDIVISSAPAPVDPTPVDPTPVDPTPTVTNPVITIGVNFVNNTGTTVTLDGDMVFVLGNPDHNGNYFGGYAGPYLNTSHLRFSNSSVTLAPGETKSFGGISWRDGDTGQGMGETSPLQSSLLGRAQTKSNVLVYVDGNSEMVICDNLDSSIVFKEGGTYDIYLSSNSGSNPAPTPVDPTPVDPTPVDPTPVDPTPVNPTPTPSANHSVVSFGLDITNTTNQPVTLVGEVVFILGNPDHNGNYFGNYTGRYVRTDHISFSNSAVTLGAGETRHFDGVSWRDADSGLGMGETSPLDPGLLSAIGRKSNVLLYVYEADGTKNSEIAICSSMPSSTIFRNGETYSISISSVSTPTPAPTPVPTPTPTPVNPSAGKPVISIGLNITNAHGSAVTLVGEVVFILGNPDHNGNIFGNYTGRYVRTDHIIFSAPITLGAGETRRFDGISWRDGGTGQGMGEASPFNPSLLSSIGRKSNVLLYVYEADGTKNSEIVICDPMNSGIIFQNGGVYDVIFR